MYKCPIQNKQHHFLSIEAFISIDTQKYLPLQDSR